MRSVFTPFVKEDNDSDQSISEDEDVNGDLSENWISLGNPVEKEGNLQVLSQLDLLRDDQEFGSAIKTINSLPEKQNDFCHEDEIEFPAFDNADDPVNIPKTASTCISDGEIISFPDAAYVGISDEEIVSDDDKDSFPASGSIKRYDARGTQTEDSREAESLVYSSGQGKHKASSSFCSHSHKDNMPLLSNNKNKISSLLVVQPAEALNSTTRKQWSKSIVELLEDNSKRSQQSENTEVPMGVLVQHGSTEHSMTEFLDCFQERSGLPQSNLRMGTRTKRRSGPLLLERTVYSLGNENMDNDFVIEALDSEQSSGDEDDPQGSIIPGKTMTDQFQEALAAVYANDGAHIAFPRQLSGGLFGRLQCVMQNEKEMEMLFLRMLSTDDCLKGDDRCIDVKILSRSLEAKLTVCCCTLVRDEENIQRMNESERTKKSGRTSSVIFNSKTCNDVELEVGNLVRIHPPWKEVHVKGYDEIILSTYFSQI